MSILWTEINCSVALHNPLNALTTRTISSKETHLHGMLKQTLESSLLHAKMTLTKTTLAKAKKILTNGIQNQNST